MSLKENEPYLKKLNRFKGLRKFESGRGAFFIGEAMKDYDKIKKEEAKCWVCGKKAWKKHDNGWWFCKKHFKETEEKSK